jgi:hypothetical protein
VFPSPGSFDDLHICLDIAVKLPRPAIAEVELTQSAGAKDEALAIFLGIHNANSAAMRAITPSTRINPPIPQFAILLQSISAEQGSDMSLMSCRRVMVEKMV